MSLGHSKSPWPIFPLPQLALSCRICWIFSPDPPTSDPITSLPAPSGHMPARILPRVSQPTVGGRISPYPSFAEVETKVLRKHYRQGYNQSQGAGDLLYFPGLWLARLQMPWGLCHLLKYRGPRRCHPGPCKAFLEPHQHTRTSACNGGGTWSPPALMDGRPCSCLCHECESCLPSQTVTWLPAAAAMCSFLQSPGT